MPVPRCATRHTEKRQLKRAKLTSSGPELRNNGKAQTFGVTFKGFDLAVTDEIVVGLGIAGLERCLVAEHAEHVEDDDGELVSRGDNGLSRVERWRK